MEEEVLNLILENEKLIYKAASYFSSYASIEDLYQVGCIGIIKGYPNYDQTRNTKFSTYIYSYIIGEMKKMIREDKPIKIGREMSHLKSQVLEAYNKLSQKLMRNPTDQELCEFLGIEEYNLAEIRNSNIIVESIDQNISDTNILMHEIISSPMINYDDLIYLKTEIESLEEPERTIMINRYFEDMTQSQVAKNIGINQVEVSRREKKVLSKIKAVH